MATIAAIRARRLILTGVLAAGLGAGAAGVASGATHAGAGTARGTTSTAITSSATLSSGQPAARTTPTHHCAGVGPDSPPAS